MVGMSSAYIGTPDVMASRVLLMPQWETNHPVTLEQRFSDANTLKEAGRWHTALFKMNC